jgi:hypothetical protein
LGRAAGPGQPVREHRRAGAAGCRIALEPTRLRTINAFSLCALIYHSLSPISDIFPGRLAKIGHLLKQLANIWKDVEVLICGCYTFGRTWTED